MQNSSEIDERQSEQLTNEELAILIQSGNRQYIPQLWNQVYRFLDMKASMYFNYACNSMKNVLYELDDLKQEGFFAMIAAAEKFSPEKGCSFLTLFSLCLKTAFANVSGSGSFDPLFSSISGDVQMYDDDHGTILDFIPDERSFGDGSVESMATAGIEANELHDILEKCLRSLPQTDETILRGLYYQGRSSKDIAEELHCTQQNIYAKKQSALEDLYTQRNINGLADFLDRNTNFYRKSSVRSFNLSGTSVVESLVFERDRLAKKWIRLQKLQNKRAEETEQ